MITLIIDNHNNYFLGRYFSCELSTLIFSNICRGRIRVSYDVGNNPVSTMFSYEILNDGKYHTVQLLSVMKVKQRVGFIMQLEGQNVGKDF